jgi:integrase
MPLVTITTRGAAAAGRAAMAPEPEQLTLFDLGIDLQSLRRERAAMAERKRALNTRLAYESDWRDFAAWCASAGREALPASADTVSLYLVALAGRGRLPSTIGRRVVSIAAQHLAAGHASPATADVGEVLAGIRRKLGTAPVHRKAALSVDDLRLMLPACGDGPRGARDRALLLVGFASGLRRSELAGLDLADVSIEREGLVLRVRRSKADQMGAGRMLGVHRGRRRSTDPVQAFEAWILERGEWAGALFCRLALAGDAVMRRRLSGRAVAEVVQAAARSAGLDASRYAGHSLRAGCATAAAAGGASDLAIMGRTGHKSAAMMGRYVRHGSLFAVDPLAGAL